MRLQPSTRGHTLFAAAYAMLHLGCPAVQAELPLPTPLPRVCLSADPAVKRFGRVALTSNRGECHANYVLYNLENLVGPNLPAKDLGITGDCCPLPGDDVLDEAVPAVYASERCPDGFVAAGYRGEPWCNFGCGHEMRCVKINTTRYQLGPERNGVFWGAGAGARHQARVLKRHDIPVALRYGMARLDKFAWGTDGCIGDPPGSLMVSKLSKHCDDHGFRELQYRGIPGDPPSGTPVKMFADCRRVADIFALVGECAP